MSQPNAPQDDLTAERAAKIMRSLDISSPHMQQVIEQALRQTRQAALRECLEIARADGNIIAVREQLDRLASEGAPAPIDLLPKLKDDGGYGEHF